MVMNEAESTGVERLAVVRPFAPPEEPARRAPHDEGPCAVRRFGPLMTCARSMYEVFDLLDAFARTEVTMTLLGETGSGKDVIARAIHAQSHRADRPFVVFDGGAVAQNLTESELLGHERGAFTGAVAPHAGAFERAHGGTLFLDEIAELPIELQPRLLRALDSRRVRRVGGQREIDVSVRVVAATNRDLRAEVAAGRFREDLYFRLAGAVVLVPALRERLDDLPMLVQVLLDALGQDHVRVADDALNALRAHTWPGNIRELKNAISCAVALHDPREALIQRRSFRLHSPPREQASPLGRLPLAGHSLDAIERAAIEQTLVQAEGNKVDAARRLGIAVSTLYKKLRTYGI
jgi:DNA-binding NtrC family response regulator